MSYKNFPQQIRAAQLDASTFNEKDNTVEVIFTSGASVKRYDRAGAYMEDLLTGAENVRLDRLNLGAPFLDTHDSFDLSRVLGSVVPGTARMENGFGYATIKLTRRPDAAGIVQDIRDGVIKNTSVGYRYHKVEEADSGDVRTVRVVDWEPLEISAVPIPADALSQIRNDGDRQAEYPALVEKVRSPEEQQLDAVIKSWGPMANTRRAQMRRLHMKKFR